MWAIHIPMGSLRGNDREKEIALRKWKCSLLRQSEKPEDACERSVRYAGNTGGRISVG